MLLKKIICSLFGKPENHLQAQAAKAEEEKNNIWTNAFINQMEYAYAAADVVVARAGAMTIAELGVVGKAADFCSVSVCSGRSPGRKCAGFG